MDFCPMISLRVKDYTRRVLLDLQQRNIMVMVSID